VVFVEFVATPQDVVVEMLQLARVTTDDVVYDLGCGDGRIVATAAKEYRCRVVRTTSRADGRNHLLYLWTCPLKATR